MRPEGQQRRDLPRDWRWAKLGDIIAEGPTNGHSPRSNPGAAGTLTLRLSATTPGHLVLNDATTKRLDEQVPAESPLWLRPGDLLVQRSNTAELVGTAAIYDGPPATYVYPDLLMRLRFDDLATARWVWRFLNSPTGKRQLQQLAGGSAGNMPKISGAKLVGVPIPLPPLAEQRRITALLDKADAIRRKRQQAIRLADELLRSAFLDMFGDPITNPKGWPTQTLGTCAEFVGGGTPSRDTPAYYGGDVCWATSKDMKGEELRDTQEHITPQAIANSATKLVPPGTILVVVKSKVLMHTLPVALTCVPTCFGQDLKGVVPHAVPARYVARHMRVGAAALLAQARGVNTEGLTLEHLRSYRLMTPPPAAVERYLSVEQRCLALRANATAAGSTAGTQLCSIAQRAFSGQF